MKHCAACPWSRTRPWSASSADATSCGRSSGPMSRSAATSSNSSSATPARWAVGTSTSPMAPPRSDGHAGCPTAVRSSRKVRCGPSLSRSAASSRSECCRLSLDLLPWLGSRRPSDADAASHGSTNATSTATARGALLTSTRINPMTGALNRTTAEPLQWAPPRPTPAELARQVRDVLADLPRFLTAPLFRGWHLHWGASPAEVADRMPGDDLFPRAQYRCTRAITIAAPPEEVWPWLVQVGCLRAGWYADDLLDDLARPSARQIVPQLQDLQVGRWLPLAPSPSAATTFVVASFQTPRWMLWRSPSRDRKSTRLK